MKRRLVRHTRHWSTRLGAMLAVAVLFVVFALTALVMTFSTFYPISSPLNLLPLLPHVESYLAGVGLKVTANRLVAYYQDGSVVLGGDDLRVYNAANNELAVVVEKALVELSRKRMFIGVPAPKVVRAQNVTLRVIRDKDVVQLAGFPLARNEDESNMGDVVAWLNGLSTALRWGALEEGSVVGLTLLLHDNVQKSEWVMEDGTLAFRLNRDDGDKATLTAQLRRLYGGKEIAPTPVAVVFEHAAGAENAILRARFENSDVDMVADYFPPQIEKMFKATGKVELGMLLTQGNRLGKPWVTLLLHDVTITPPMGFSKPLGFKTFNVTVAYTPQPDDVLSISSLKAEDAQGMVMEGQGRIGGLGSASVIPLESKAEVAQALAAGASHTVVGGQVMVSATVTTPAENVETVSSTLVADVTLRVAKGKAQQAFRYFPDEDIRFKKALAWLKPNILEGDFSNLVLSYRGKPADLPHCGDACGLTITATVEGGKVRYLDNLPPAVVQEKGMFSLVGETIRVQVPRATTASQTGENVDVRLTELFSDVPTVVQVRTKLAGPLDEVVREVGKIDKPLPLSADGRHVTDFALDLPLIKNKPTELADADIRVDSKVADVTLSRFADVKNTNFKADKGTFTMQGSTASFKADGSLNGNPMDVNWQDDWKTPGKKAMKLTARGTVNGDWLRANGLPESVEVDGPVAVDLTLNEQGGDTALSLTADATRAKVVAKDLAFSKATGGKLALRAKGDYRAAGGVLQRVQLDTLSLQGSGVDVQGGLTYVPDNLAATRLALSPFRLGKTDAVLNWNGSAFSLSGKQLDAAPFMKGDGSGNGLPDNLEANVNVGNLLLEKGALTGLKASLSRRNKVWEVEQLTARANGQNPVNVQTVPLGGGRRRMNVDIANLGQLLAITDVYPRMLGGHLQGQLNYDAPNVAGGVMTLRDFELDNPPTLVRLLSLLSLEQLLAGTDKLKFNRATLPMRLDGAAIHLDKAVAEGPAMTLRLDGVYYRDTSTMNFDGRMAPAIPFNRLIAKIPLIGTLLTGSQDGVVVADFKMKGASADPKIEVRPLSILTPGLIKDIFRGGEAPPTPQVESNVP
ncbi:MAG: hypothetical protein H6922_00620 [Pseudomonadaceae bacterium]|nr:hypothetical protein [Pseudomonadaceae bacterium]